METILIVKDWSFEEYYQQSLDYLNSKFFSHPDVLSGYQVTEAELHQMSCPSLAGRHSGEGERHPGRPNGKQVR
jgi:hypothetical protein